MSRAPASPHRREDGGASGPREEGTRSEALRTERTTVRTFFTDDNHVVYHLWSLICGLCLVTPLYISLIRGFPVQFRYLPTGIGIISRTTLDHYPVKQELYGYVLALAVLIVGSGLVWLAWLVFSLSLSAVLSRDFGTVATRGCWALSLFVLIYPVASPYAWLNPAVTLALLAAAAVASLMLQVVLVLSFPQRFDREIGQVALAENRLIRRVVSVVRRGSRLTWPFLTAVALSWALFAVLSGSSERGGVAVALMALLVLALPVLFAVGWVALCGRWAGAREEGSPPTERPAHPPDGQRWHGLAEGVSVREHSGRARTVPRGQSVPPPTGGKGPRAGPLHILMVLVAGLGLIWYLYFVAKNVEVMLTATTVVGALLLLSEVRPRLTRAARWLKTLAAVVGLVVALVLLALVTFDAGFLSTPASLDPDFLREDGSHLAWADAILRGGMQGRDFYSMYGPLLHYGLVATMRMVGVMAEAAPLYWWVGRAAGAAAAALLLWGLTGNALYAVLAVCVLHTGVGLRTAPALAALAAFTYFARTRKPIWALVAGLLVGIGLAVSHEFGLCALLACGAATAVLVWRYETRRLAGAGLGALVVGAALALAPVAAHFAVAGCLGDVVRDLVHHPGYVLMGYGNLPFPNRFPLLTQGRPVWQVVAELLKAGPLCWYFPVIVWVVTLQLVLFRYVMGKATARDLGALSVTVFGILAFRTVLGRSDVVHLHLVMPVAVVLFLWQVWLLVGRLRTVFSRARLRVVNVAEFAALSLAVVFLVDHASLRGTRVAVLWSQVSRAARAVALVPAHLKAPSQLERSVVPVGSSNVLADIVEYVQQQVSGVEPVLAVPNMPVFYFLTDRPNATRFAAMAQLVTNEHRVEASRELQEEFPSLVLFHGGDNNIDDIPASRQFPNVLNLILTRYTPVAKFGPVYVLGRAAAEPGSQPVRRWNGETGPAQWRIHGDLTRVTPEADGTCTVRAGNRPVTFTVDLNALPGQRYRTLRVHTQTRARGELRVDWRTREPLDADEKAWAALPLPVSRGEVAAADVDMRDYPSWLFNHIRQFSVTVPAQGRLALAGIELLPMETSPEEGEPRDATGLRVISQLEGPG